MTDQASLNDPFGFAPDVEAVERATQPGVLDDIGHLVADAHVGIGCLLLTAGIHLALTEINRSLSGWHWASPDPHDPYAFRRFIWILLGPMAIVWGIVLMLGPGMLMGMAVATAVGMLSALGIGLWARRRTRLRRRLVPS